MIDSAVLAENDSPRHRRLIIFTDMSTECDDECALLWLLAELNKKPYETTVELIMTDAEMRYSWMQFIFDDKFECDGGWTQTKDGFAFVAGPTEVNLYLAPSEKKDTVVADIKKKAPQTFVALAETPDAPKEEGGSPSKSICALQHHLRWLDYQEVPEGPAATIVIAAPCWGVDPSFFSRFKQVRNIFVVGTPGGVNCPMTNWKVLLQALNNLAPVIYLTPQFTRGVRFPTNYVLKNDAWNEHIKSVVWESTLTMMARRPEIPAKFGDWGLVLRLNSANAGFCKTWIYDVVQLSVEDIPPPEDIVACVKAYVKRNSGTDRKCGAVAQEMQNMGFTTQAELDNNGQPVDDNAREVLCADYRKLLFQEVYTCVLTTSHLLFDNPKNFKKCFVPGSDSGHTLMKKISGYSDRMSNLADIYGVQEALELLRSLRLKHLTPAYDVVGMMCAVTSLESKRLSDIGINMQDADESMNLGIQHTENPIMMIPKQEDKVVDWCIQQLEIKEPASEASSGAICQCTPGKQMACVIS